jgi:hypothetical protein
MLIDAGTWITAAQRRAPVYFYAIVDVPDDIDGEAISAVRMVTRLRPEPPTSVEQSAVPEFRCGFFRKLPSRLRARGCRQTPARVAIYDKGDAVGTFTRRIRPSLSRLAALILGLGAVGVALVATSVPAAAATPCSAPTGTNPFTVTCPVGIADTWVVPANVTRATFTVFGAEGGVGDTSPSGVTAGNGGELSATLSVATGDTYDIAVGAAGGNGTRGVFSTGGLAGRPAVRLVTAAVAPAVAVAVAVAHPR